MPVGVLTRTRRPHHHHRCIRDMHDISRLASSPVKGLLATIERHQHGLASVKDCQGWYETVGIYLLSAQKLVN